MFAGEFKKADGMLKNFVQNLESLREQFQEMLTTTPGYVQERQAYLNSVLKRERRLEQQCEKLRALNQIAQSNKDEEVRT